ncbi:Aspartyl-tRNA synthetase [[Mycoplasma] cavipharyngis]|uniref:aspartate--tRNA ligase n=1 Tax=[Mycoplasma] cavipharyngis TaxID=92757 RepID=UPI00370414EC
MNPLLKRRITIAKAAEQHQLNPEVVLAGFMRKIRKLGKLCFVILADTTGEIQLVLKDHLVAQVLHLNKESIICVKGVFQLRKDQASVKKTFSCYEVIVSAIEVINEARKQLPFIIDDVIQANEDTLLSYRYLHLRSSLAANYLIQRSKIINLFRNFLLEQNFIEVETPILGRSTPEGARDYLVPVRTKKAPRGYALPQSPQLYKQLLMVAGFEKYFQIAKNFRDEDLRSDRQPEFSQLDLEMAYTNTENFMILIEKMMAYVWKQFFQIDLITPFPRISYFESIEKYGNDKPDLRFSTIIKVHDDFFIIDCFNKIKNDLSCRSLLFENLVLNQIQLEQIKKWLKDFYQIDHFFWAVNDNNDQTGNLFNQQYSAWIDQNFNPSTNFATLLVIANDQKNLHQIAGALRNYVIQNFIDQNQLDPKFVWIIDWPLFEYSETDQKWVAAHNPFTMPDQKSIATFINDPENAKAASYDLVLNGIELGSGSCRITDPDLQQKMLEFLGLDLDSVNKNFGWFIEAYQYAAPPHQGIGIGLDRLLQIMLNAQSIRDVIAFPKNNSGHDLMQNAPAVFESEQLMALNLKNNKN